MNGGHIVQKGLPCQCPYPYSGNVCEKTIGSNININSCMPNPCRNYGICKITPIGYTCTCTGNYYGSRCEGYRSYRNSRILGM